MKLSLTYIAINTDVDPPILTTANGFQIVATDSALQQAHTEAVTMSLELVKAIAKAPTDDSGK